MITVTHTHPIASPTISGEEDQMQKSQYEANMNNCPYAPLSTEAGSAHFEILNFRTPSDGIRRESIEHGSDLHYYADGSALITHPAGGDESFAFSSDAEDRVQELMGSNA